MIEFAERDSQRWQKIHSILCTQMPSSYIHDEPIYVVLDGKRCELFYFIRGKTDNLFYLLLVVRSSIEVGGYLFFDLQKDAQSVDNLVNEMTRFLIDKIANLKSIKSYARNEQEYEIVRNLTRNIKYDKMVLSFLQGKTIANNVIDYVKRYLPSHVLQQHQAQ